MKPHIQRSTNLHTWVCHFPDEPYAISRRGYGRTPAEAYQSLLEKMRAEAFVRYCLPDSKRASALALYESQAPQAPLHPPNPTLETRQPPVTMTDGLHRRVRKILDTFPHLRYTRSR